MARPSGAPATPGPILSWTKVGKGAYQATAPSGLYTIDGNNAGRNRWTITYPDGDYGMVDSLGEAKAWGEVHAGI